MPIETIEQSKLMLSLDDSVLYKLHFAQNVLVSDSVCQLYDIVPGNVFCLFRYLHRLFPTPVCNLKDIPAEILKENLCNGLINIPSDFLKKIEESNSLIPLNNQNIQLDVEEDEDDDDFEGNLVIVESNEEESDSSQLELETLMPATVEMESFESTFINQIGNQESVYSYDVEMKRDVLSQCQDLFITKPSPTDQLQTNEITIELKVNSVMTKNEVFDMPMSQSSELNNPLLVPNELIPMGNSVLYDKDVSDEPTLFTLTRDTHIFNLSIMPANRDTFPTSREVKNKTQFYEYVAPLLKIFEPEKFSSLMHSLSEDILASSGALLRLYVLQQYDRQQYENVIQLIKRFNFNEKDHHEMQHLWDKAHINIWEQQTGKLVSSVQKFRLRKRNPYPPTIWDGDSCYYGIKQTVRDMLMEEFVKDPNPDKDKLKMISLKTGFPYNKGSNDTFAFLPKKRMSLFKELHNLCKLY